MGNANGKHAMKKLVIGIAMLTAVCVATPNLAYATIIT
jgi:hypothetical protein